MGEIPMLARRIEDFAEAHHLSAELTLQLQLCCEEMVSNIINHAFDGDEAHDIGLSFNLHGAELGITITDDGKPFSPLDVAPPDLSASITDRAVGGLGVHLVRTFMDRIEYEREGEYNRVTMFKKV